ncbi:MAG: hypothetical protein FWB73_07990 [Treponema sp.]|nr:hypothetical protein [Treponema sp.]
MRSFFILSVLTVSFLFCGCTATINIKENMSPAEIIQRGQEALDRNNYRIAIQYYEALHERNPDNIDLIITAEYHIGNIHYKQKKYSLARDELNAVLEYYNTPDEILLPQHFKRLAQIVLKSMDDKGK